MHNNGAKKAPWVGCLGCMCGSRGVITSGKPQVVLGFHRNTGTDLREKQLDPTGPAGPIASRGRSVGPSLKHVVYQRTRVSVPRKLSHCALKGQFFSLYFTDKCLIFHCKRIFHLLIH